MRAVALLGLHVKDPDVRQFEMPGVNLFSGNEIDPSDQPDAALIFGGDGTIHRHRQRSESAGGVAAVLRWR